MREVRTMHYLEAYSYYFKSAKWWLNLLLGAVCVLVPIVGPMVLMGWAFVILERSPRQWDQDSDFDANKLGTYLLRGLWPFLVQLVIGLPVGFLLGLIWFVVVMGSVIASGPQGGQAGPPRFFLLIFPTYIISIIVLSVIIQMITLPMALRAGLTQDFASGFKFSWAVDFIKRTWVEMLLSMLFFVVTSPFIALAGLVLCCAGVYPAQALIMLAHYHIWFQLYDLFLQRGGEPIPLKVVAPERGPQPEEN
jgi:hypothetical protein